MMCYYLNVQFQGQRVNSRISMAKAAINNKKTLFTSRLDLILGKKPVKCYIWCAAFVRG